MQVATEHPESVYEILPPEMPSGIIKVGLAISDYLLRQKANKK